jgi:dipeptidyl aminopeptidase/acylaminoacyl peptidase
MIVRPRPQCVVEVVLALRAAASVTASAAAQSRRAMTVDDVLDLVQVSAPRLSPDGRRVLYTRSELTNWKDNKRVTSIWIAETDGSNARRFLANEKDRAWKAAERNGADAGADKKTTDP